MVRVCVLSCLLLLVHGGSVVAPVVVAAGVVVAWAPSTTCCPPQHAAHHLLPHLLPPRYVLAPDLNELGQQADSASSEQAVHRAGTAAAAAGHAEQPPGDRPSSSAAAAATAEGQGQGPAAAAGDGTPSSTDGSDTSSIGFPTEGSMTLLVMEYCSLGNLHKAITAGRYHNARRQPNLVRPARGPALAFLYPALGSNARRGGSAAAQAMASTA